MAGGAGSYYAQLGLSAAKDPDWSSIHQAAKNASDTAKNVGELLQKGISDTGNFASDIKKNVDTVVQANAGLETEMNTVLSKMEFNKQADEEAAKAREEALQSYNAEIDKKIKQGEATYGQTVEQILGKEQALEYSQLQNAVKIDKQNQDNSEDAQYRAQRLNAFNDATKIIDQQINVDFEKNRESSPEQFNQYQSDLEYKQSTGLSPQNFKNTLSSEIERQFFISSNGTKLDYKTIKYYIDRPELIEEIAERCYMNKGSTDDWIIMNGLKGIRGNANLMRMLNFDKEQDEKAARRAQGLYSPSERMKIAELTLDKNIATVQKYNYTGDMPLAFGITSSAAVLPYGGDLHAMANALKVEGQENISDSVAGYNMSALDKIPTDENGNPLPKVESPDNKPNSTDNVSQQQSSGNSGGSTSKKRPKTVTQSIQNDNIDNDEETVEDIINENQAIQRLKIEDELSDDGNSAYAGKTTLQSLKNLPSKQQVANNIANANDIATKKENLLKENPELSKLSDNDLEFYVNNKDSIIDSEQGYNLKKQAESIRENTALGDVYNASYDMAATYGNKVIEGIQETPVLGFVAAGGGIAATGYTIKKGIDGAKWLGPKIWNGISKHMPNAVNNALNKIKIASSEAKQIKEIMNNFAQNGSISAEDLKKLQKIEGINNFEKEFWNAIYNDKRIDPSIREAIRKQAIRETHKANMPKIREDIKKAVKDKPDTFKGVNLNALLDEVSNHGTTSQLDKIMTKHGLSAEAQKILKPYFEKLTKINDAVYNLTSNAAKAASNTKTGKAFDKMKQSKIGQAVQKYGGKGLRAAGKVSAVVDLFSVLNYAEHEWNMSKNIDNKQLREMFKWQITQTEEDGGIPVNDMSRGGRAQYYTDYANTANTLLDNETSGGLFSFQADGLIHYKGEDLDDYEKKLRIMIRDNAMTADNLQININRYVEGLTKNGAALTVVKGMILGGGITSANERKNAENMIEFLNIINKIGEKQLKQIENYKQTDSYRDIQNDKLYNDQAQQIENLKQDKEFNAQEQIEVSDRIKELEQNTSTLSEAQKKERIDLRKLQVTLKEQENKLRDDIYIAEKARFYTGIGLYPDTQASDNVANLYITINNSTLKSAKAKNLTSNNTTGDQDIEAIKAIKTVLADFYYPSTNSDAKTQAGIDLILKDEKIQKILKDINNENIEENTNRVGKTKYYDLITDLSEELNDIIKDNMGYFEGFLENQVVITDTRKIADLLAGKIVSRTDFLRKNPRLDFTDPKNIAKMRRSDYNFKRKYETLRSTSDNLKERFVGKGD